MIELGFRRVYAGYEWLRDGASPFDAMSACRLQSPNWWRTARDALAAARALLEGSPEPPLDGGQTDLTGDDQAWLVAAAVRWTFEAAVAMRLPYGALQPGEAWALGWRGTWPECTSAGGDSTLAACRTILAAAAVRCRREGVVLDRLVAALDHAAHVRAVCYTRRQSHR